MIFRIYDSKRMDMYIQTIRQNQLARFRNVSWHVYIIYLFIPCRCRRGYIFTRYCRTLSNVSQIIWTGFFSIVNICITNTRNGSIFKIMRLNLLFMKSVHRCAFHTPLQWCHDDHDGASNHQPHDCLLNRLFRRRSKKTLNLRVTGLCVGNSSVTDEFLAQRASNAENVSIWWHHHYSLRFNNDKSWICLACSAIYLSWMCLYTLWLVTWCDIV